MKNANVKNKLKFKVYVEVLRFVEACFRPGIKKNEKITATFNSQFTIELKVAIIF